MVEGEVEAKKEGQVKMEVKVEVGFAPLGLSPPPHPYPREPVRTSV